MIPLSLDEDVEIVDPSGEGVGRDPFPNDRYPPPVIEVVISIDDRFEGGVEEPSEIDVVGLVGLLDEGEGKNLPPGDDTGRGEIGAEERDAEGNDADIGIKDVQVGANDVGAESIDVATVCLLSRLMVSTKVEIEVEDAAGVVETNETCDEGAGVDPVEGRIAPGFGSGRTNHC